jgi:hypothetical protein
MIHWAENVRRWVPRRVRYTLQRHVSLTGLKMRAREHANPLAGVLANDENTAGSPARFGIVKNEAQYHRHFVAACLEEGVPFRVVDLASPRWLDEVEGSGCEVLLVWPDAVLSVRNRMIKDRVELLERELGYAVVPSSREIWMYEDKVRTADWLRAHQIPHPRTWVFHGREEALDFAGSCELPVVVKTSFGAAATGVWVVRSRRKTKALTRSAFKRGLLAGGSDPADRQWGRLLFQQYLPDVIEWRMVRIGDSYFGHPKGRVGEFHSGSGKVEWDAPPVSHLDLLHEVCELGGFRTMDVDLFETPDGQLLVNELQAVFGASVAIDQSRVDGEAGRYVRLGPSQWRFEAGDFARNACANARVRDALRRGLRRRTAGQAGSLPGSAAKAGMENRP